MSNDIKISKSMAGWALAAGLLLAIVGVAGATLLSSTMPVEAAIRPVEAAPVEQQTVNAGVTHEATGLTAETRPDSELETEPAVQQNAAPIAVTQSATSSAYEYRGDVLAKDTVQVMVEVIGQVIELPVQVGEFVQQGDLLLQIDDTSLMAQRAQALAGLEAAEAQLNTVLLDADDSDLAAAQAGVAAASAAYRRALEGATEEELAMAEAQMRSAEALVTQAQAAYNEIDWMNNKAMMPQSLALEQATLQAEAAHAAYEKVLIGSTEDVIDGAYAQLAAAQATLDRLEDGAKEPQIDAVRAQVRQAETALLLMDIQVAKASIESPIDGYVNTINTAVGANVAPGGPVFMLLSDEVKVVVNVEEARRDDVYVGQPATIELAAYPGRQFDGQVSTISPSVNPMTRTFEVTIEPTGDAAELASGMSATVTLGGK